MEVKFRKMNTQEFDSYSQYSIDDYVKDLMKSSGRTEEDAILQAKEEFASMLPEGLHTKGNSLMMIEDVHSGQVVGIIWYLYEFYNEVKQVFLSDFFIYEEERRKGYATAALAEMEHLAAKNNCKESIIYVWEHNTPGVNLYRKCGYVTFKETDDGMYMKKEISGRNYIDFKILTSVDAPWSRVKNYADNCSWRSGKALAQMMDKGAFQDWERVVAALDGEEICGYCTVAKTDCIPDVEYTPYIGFLFVDEAYRGNRLSQQIILHAMDYLKSVGFEKVYLVSDHVNLYEKYGFQVIDRKMAPWGEEEKIYVQKLG